MPTMTLTIERTPRTLQFGGETLHVVELGVRLPFARKPESLDEMCASGNARIYITETVEMTPAEFDTFARHLYLSRDWPRGKGGNIAGGVLCVEVHAPGRPYLYVDPSGGDYARYVARLG